MSHETHEAAHHGTDKKLDNSLKSSFWFVIILAVLFIAAINFVDVMGNDEGGHGGGHEGTTHHNNTAGHGNPPASHEPAGHQGGEIITDTAHNAGEHVTDTAAHSTSHEGTEGHSEGH